MAIVCASMSPAIAVAQPRAALSLHASPALDTHHRPVVLTGAAVGVPAGTDVDLDQAPYPYSTRTQIATAVTDAQGNFSFTVHPDRNTRYIAIIPSTGAQVTVQVAVENTRVIKIRAVSLGRAELTILVFHPADLRWNGARVHWAFARLVGGFTAAPTTLSRRLSRYVTVLRTVVALPAGHFRWRVCFTARAVAAFTEPLRPRGCQGLGYHGRGFLPAGFPGPKAIARAERYLAGRAGRTAFAVIDSQGRMSGANLHSTFITGSVVKAMLLVAYLRRLDALGQRTVDAGSDSFLYPMINVSDNNAATRCWSIVGNGGLYAVAHAAGMTEFSVTTDWGSAQLSAADQARFFFEMDSLIPREFVGYARYLLSTIASYESWGIPAIARQLGYNVFFKGGWRGTGLGQLVHQIARLEGHGRTFSIAVMTDGDPSMQYGIDTIQGVTQALLG
ncbi:MAG TPA: hypothetical protein VIX82_10400 [Solirubrobacteraceae bacterium]